MDIERHDALDVDIVDKVDNVRNSLDGLSTITLSLAVSEMADKPSLSVVSDLLSSCSESLGDVSEGVQRAVLQARRQSAPNRGAREACDQKDAAPLSRGYVYAALDAF